MKVAVYARYSSDNQRDASIADQLRICRLHAEKQGWEIVEEYTDHATSGASLLRPGIQALMADAARGRFDVILAEAMDRLSRDQEDIAGLFKRMAYADTKIVTLSEGEVTHLHIGLKGTMNALFLKDLADKTRRGLRGRVEQGKSGGGNAYGYDVVKSLDEHGELVRGTRTINEEEAEIVRRIFREYCAGKSGRAIAADLNREGIPCPSGGDWGFSTINGNPKRGTGILNNEMYVGKLVWNRQRFIKDPDTGKRQARPNPQSEWIVQAVPELRIVGDELWHEAKDRQARVSVDTVGQARPRKRPKYMLSGLLQCGCCGGAVTLISQQRVGCASARNKGTCDNRRSIRRDRLEDRVIHALRHHLMDPALFAEFCEEFTQEMNRLRKNAGKATEAARAEVSKIDRDLDKLVDMILAGGNADKINQRMLKMEARKRDLEAQVSQAQEPPPQLHPSMAHHYRAQLDNLTRTLSSKDECNRLIATEIIRSLIDRIILIPEGDGLIVDVHGDLASILTIAAERKKPAKKQAGSSGSSGSGNDRQFRMVAGAGHSMGD
ncbi:DNA invertase Pin-like site-specific DNA recombinase [Novosphingobium sp. PhB165]|uniref:recombinase family protein n=1 Tax=Novosphingobium sp. PhB165 TaxID=2485105 RepID=UPI0010445059|nr:recombinase family protein [Novosphingobium sp. PhB165]TCM14212.1 DNA invertase Pin-like site-specific DNA recombinase [Novosphingobium sp. PhB165]